MTEYTYTLEKKKKKKTPYFDFKRQYKNYTQYFIIIYKGNYLFIYVTESLCFTTETSKILYIYSISI